MKVILEFDSKSDKAQVIYLAVRAEHVYSLIADLLFQLTQWIKENPNDQQGIAFQKTRDWLRDAILNRGLYVSDEQLSVCVDRAGNPAPEQTEQPE